MNLTALNNPVYIMGLLFFFSVIGVVVYQIVIYFWDKYKNK